jgi:subtilisin family serine protease
MDYIIPPDLEVGAASAIEDLATVWSLPPAIWNKIWTKVTGNKIKAAVLDTGYKSHPLLPEPIKTRSFISGQSVQDGNGHGTHCAGTVLGRKDIGVAPNAELMVYKVLSNQGSGSSTGIARGIVAAVEDGANVLSLSLGGGGSDTETNAAIDYAWKNHCWVFVAAGNSGYNGSNTIGWPGKYKGSMCTGAYDRNGRIANFSSGGRELDWACPGVDIPSCGLNNDIRNMSGTSMATPHGAGIGCLLYEALLKEGYSIPNTPEKLLEVIKLIVVDAGEPGNDVRFGLGKPEIDKLVMAFLKENILGA